MKKLFFILMLCPCIGFAQKGVVGGEKITFKGAVDMRVGKYEIKSDSAYVRADGTLAKAYHAQIAGVKFTISCDAVTFNTGSVTGLLAGHLQFHNGKQYIEAADATLDFSDDDLKGMVNGIRYTDRD